MGQLHYRHTTLLAPDEQNADNTRGLEQTVLLTLHEHSADNINALPGAGDAGGPLFTDEFWKAGSFNHSGITFQRFDSQWSSSNIVRLAADRSKVAMTGLFTNVHLRWLISTMGVMQVCCWMAWAMHCSSKKPRGIAGESLYVSVPWHAFR